MAEESVLELASRCVSGEVQLPEFQRKFKWKQAQVKLLFDSIRLNYPIGSVILLQTGPHVDLPHRPMRGTENTVKTNEPDYLILDGQQRLTAAIDLYFSVSKHSTMYYIDLIK